MTFNRTDRRAAQFERKPQTPAFAGGCPHRIAVWQDANPDRPRNARLARAAVPCRLRPGHDGVHLGAGGRSWP